MKKVAGSAGKRADEKAGKRAVQSANEKVERSADVLATNRLKKKRRLVRWLEGYDATIVRHWQLVKSSVPAGSAASSAASLAGARAAARAANKRVERGQGLEIMRG